MFFACVVCGLLSAGAGAVPADDAFSEPAVPTENGSVLPEDIGYNGSPDSQDPLSEESTGSIQDMQPEAGADSSQNTGAQPDGDTEISQGPQQDGETSSVREALPEAAACAEDGQGVLTDEETAGVPEVLPEAAVIEEVGQEIPAAEETAGVREALPEAEACAGDGQGVRAAEETAGVREVLPEAEVCAGSTQEVPQEAGAVESARQPVLSAASADAKQSGMHPACGQREQKKTAQAAVKETGTAAEAASSGSQTVRTTAKAAGTSKKAVRKQNRQLIRNGVYSFLSALNPFKAVDIAGAKTTDRANVQLYDLNNSDAQHFRITYHPEDGTYSIMNIRSGKYLDAAGGRSANGTNVQQYTGNSSPAQRWRIEQSADGWYVLVSALDGAKQVLDVKGGSSLNRSNVQLYASNGSKAQKFRLQPYDPSLKINISEGAYMLASALKSDGSAVLDIRGASMDNGANVQLYRNNGSAAQQFILTDMGSGQYRLMSAASGRAVSIQNGKTADGSNVRQEQAGNLSSQRWLIMDAGDGTVYLKAADAEKYLDIRGGKTANGTNVQIYRGNGTDSQKYRLVRSGSRPVANGVYFIASSDDPSFAADIWKGSKKMEANLQLYSKNGSDAQKFLFTRGADGFYTIVNIKSGHALDVSGGSVKSGANVQQYRANGTLAQKWLPRIFPDGSLTLINAKSGMLLDITGGRAENGTNLRQQSYDRSSSQKFRLEKTTGTVTKNIDYSIEEPPLARQYPQAYSVLKQEGMNLRAAYDWSESLRFVRTGLDAGAGIRKHADFGFKTKTGDCQVQSATLYEMARVLGYDVHVVYGYVPEASGKLDDHTWLEVDQDGKTLILDPTFENLTGRNGYMFPYRTPDTFIYVQYHRIN